MATRLALRALPALALALALPMATTGCDSEDDSTPTPSGGDTTDGSDAGGEPDAAEDAGGTPVEDTGGGGGGGGQECNPYLAVPANCTADEVCVFTTNELAPTECVPKGDLPFGAECQGSQQCATGVCTSLNQTASLCYRYCKVSGHCPNGEECLQLQDTKWGLCEIDDIYESCSVLAQNCTEAGKACYASGDGEICLPSGSIGAGESGCEAPSDCAPGHHCINTVCYKVCDKSKPVEQQCGGSLIAQCAGNGPWGTCQE